MTVVTTPGPASKRLHVRRLRLPPTLVTGGAILLASLFLALFPWLVAPYDPTAFDYNAILAPPRTYGVELEAKF